MVAGLVVAQEEPAIRRAGAHGIMNQRADQIAQDFVMERHSGEELQVQPLRAGLERPGERGPLDGAADGNRSWQAIPPDEGNHEVVNKTSLRALEAQVVR